MPHPCLGTCGAGDPCYRSSAAETAAEGRTLLRLCDFFSQVRANNLQELVYKHGQAGVTKASVTLVLNNEDKSGSPVGYEKYDEIHVTRQARTDPCGWRGWWCIAWPLGDGGRGRTERFVP